MVLTIKHATVTGAPANPNVLVDGPKWDADHIITGTPSGASTTAYWDTMYRLLDPAAYTYSIGKSLSMTVPVGKTWYALNAWWLNVNGTGPFFHRKLSIYDAVQFPAGTVLTTDAAQNGYIYYCDPALAAAPVGDPKEAFYARLDKLKTIAVEALKASIAAGSANATSVTESFPETFTSAVLVAVSSQDVSWTGLNAAAGGAVNTEYEISDSHQIRFASSLLLPFKRSVLSGIMSRGANIPGDFTSTTIAGTGMVLYQPLPDGW